MKKTLWTRNFTLVTGATVLGAAGGIAGNFALSFLVFEETGSTLAAAILLASSIIPNFLVPLIASPIMDRLPRKPFLVFGDLINGVLFALAGLYLTFYSFSYIAYLLFSLVLTSLGAFDSLAYNSIYPKLIPAGMEEKGYTVSGMIYPVLQVLMAPVAAVLYKAIGVANILLIQGGLSIAAALIESRIKIEEKRVNDGQKFSLKVWSKDIRAAGAYLKKEKGLLNIYGYMAVTNGIAGAYSPILVAFFSTAAGFTMAMYSFFSVAEFAGRSLGGLVKYFTKIPEKRRYSFAFFVYQLYELMDMILLWLPYPLMLANRAICGFLGINSATMRQAAVQRHIPEEYRARINAFESVLYSLAYSVLALLVGLLGEVLDYRLCITICGLFTTTVLWLTVVRGKKHVAAIYNKPSEENS
ncbi:MAG: MFS transporter [Clostridia bacterium]|nr:MFS transporter [Clostridia bacterium]